MANLQKSTSSSFPFFAILGLIFITLKLCSVISWSWWWILAPIWGPFATAIGIILICCIILGIGCIIEAVKKPRR